MNHADNTGMGLPRKYWGYEPVAETHPKIDWEERLWQLTSMAIARHLEVSESIKETKEMANKFTSLALAALEEYKSKTKQL